MAGGLVNLSEKLRNIFFETPELYEDNEASSHALSVTALLFTPPLSDGGGGLGH